MIGGQSKTAGNTGFCQAGRPANLEFCTSIQVQSWLTVLCSENRLNAKPENLGCDIWMLLLNPQ
jgi:hypothetical protein